MKPARLTALASLLLLLGCGSNDDGAAQHQPCASETFVLQGELEAAPLDLTLPLGSFGLVTIPGDASAEFGTQGELLLSYASALELGKAADATGTLTLPTESPLRPAETLCVGQGSTITHARSQGLDEAVTFSLTSLATGSSCETPLAGALEGCFAHTFEED